MRACVRTAWMARVRACARVCCVCCVCALRTRVVRYVFCVPGVCVCVCVCVLCVWQNNKHLKNNEINCQTNYCHQTKIGISLMQAAGPLACGPVAASPHIHITSTCRVCILQNKNQPATLTPKHQNTLARHIDRYLNCPRRGLPG